jgi:hypothetical protein
VVQRIHRVRLVAPAVVLEPGHEVQGIGHRDGLVVAIVSGQIGMTERVNDRGLIVVRIVGVGVSVIQRIGHGSGITIVIKRVGSVAAKSVNGVCDISARVIDIDGGIACLVIDGFRVRIQVMDKNVGFAVGVNDANQFAAVVIQLPCYLNAARVNDAGDVMREVGVRVGE